MEFGEYLRFLREKNEYSQSELAETLSYTTQAISKWESQNSKPAFDILLELCNLYQLDVDDFFDCVQDYTPKDLDYVFDAEVFGSNLRKIRICLNLTQDDFSKLLNKNRLSVLRIESAMTTPDYDLVQTVYRVFNIKPSFMLEKHEIDEFNIEFAVEKVIRKRVAIVKPLLIVYPLVIVLMCLAISLVAIFRK